MVLLLLEGGALEGKGREGKGKKRTYDRCIISGTLVGSECAGLARLERSGSWSCGCEGREGGEDKCSWYC